MKIINIFTLIEEFRNGRDIWTRNHVELAVREIRRLDKENQKLQLRLAASENDILLREVNEMLKKTQSRLQQVEDNREHIKRLLCDAEKRIAELEAEQRWIPVSEGLPEDSRIYDVAIAGYQYSWTGSCVFGKWIGESGKAILGVTHWKYRPQLPKDGK